MKSYMSKQTRILVEVIPSPAELMERATAPGLSEEYKRAYANVTAEQNVVYETDEGLVGVMSESELERDYVPEEVTIYGEAKPDNRVSLTNPMFSPVRSDLDRALEMAIMAADPHKKTVIALKMEIGAGNGEVSIAHNIRISTSEKILDTKGTMPAFVFRINDSGEIEMTNPQVRIEEIVSKSTMAEPKQEQEPEPTSENPFEEGDPTEGFNLSDLDE